MPLDGAQPADDSSRSGLRIDHRVLKVDALLLLAFKPDSEKLGLRCRLLFTRFTHAKPCSGCWMRQDSVQPIPWTMHSQADEYCSWCPLFLSG
jgi:hypothetical protein